MHALISFIYIVVDLLLQAIVWLIIAEVIVSWLVAFGVINVYNRMANQAIRILEQITSPILRPVRRIIPSLGGIDFSPMIVLIVIEAARRTLLPALANWLISITP